jgi:3-oxoacyl-[acyl-carrier protein] reductase
MLLFSLPPFLFYGGVFMQFTGKAALITGAASGIGLACARELARHGANIAIVDIVGEETLIQTSHLIKEAGVKVATFNADVIDFGKAERVVLEAKMRLGGLDILINSAGIHSDAPIWNIAETQWDRVININLKGTFNYMRSVAGIFREQKSGKIVNIASIQALRGTFGVSNYAASKAGVIGLTRSAAAELGRSNVNVNAVAPGFILTPMTEKLPGGILERAEKEAVLGRLGEPQDVASVVAFLCSEEARYITGEIVRVDGGQAL